MKAAFENRLGRNEPAILKALTQGGGLEAAGARIERMGGASRFMQFGQAATSGFFLDPSCLLRTALRASSAFLSWKVGEGLSLRLTLTLLLIGRSSLARVWLIRVLVLLRIALCFLA